MLYEAKQGTKAYEYIKGILDAEAKERQAYMKRVKEAIGFEIEKWQGYQPNRGLLREYEITAILVSSERYETLDKKVWRKVNSQTLEDGYYIAVVPNKRGKQGKAISAVFKSFKPVTNFWNLMRELDLCEPDSRSFSITQLLRHKDRIFAFFDDSIRADKRNSDFKEITISEYEDFINSKD